MNGAVEDVRRVEVSQSRQGAGYETKQQLAGRLLMLTGDKERNEANMSASQAERPSLRRLIISSRGFTLPQRGLRAEVRGGRTF